jgi:hypothetical protein
MKKISEILENKGIKKIAGAAVICSKAEKIIRQELRVKNLEVVKYQSNILFIKTTKPAIARKIYENEQDLIKKITKELNIKLDRLSYR